MKKTVLMLAALVLGSMAFAQNADKKQAVDQYGNTVDVKTLQSSSRDGILVFESKEKDYKFWFDARVQVDFGHYFGAQEWADPIGSGASIRRARFAAKAQITPDWYGEIDMELANGSFELKDAVVRYNGLKNWQFTVGSMKHDFTMSRNTSSRYLMFMERPMVINAFAPSRHLGVFAKYSNKYFFGSASVLFQEIEGQETRDYVEGHNKLGMDEGLSYLGKIVVRPVNEDNYGIHIGGAVMYDTPKTSDEDDTGDQIKGTNMITRFSCRNTTNINRRKYIDTDDIMDVHHNLIATAELAGHYNGLRLEGAWLSDWTYLKPEVGIDKPYHFQGWYVEGACLLLGGKQSYDSDGAKFNRVRTGRSWGDIELALKYEFLDMNDYEGRPLNDKADGHAIFGGAAELYGAALNFYFAKNVKIALNYQYVNNDRYANGKGKLVCGLDSDGKPTNKYTAVDALAGDAGVNYHMLLARFQVAF
jgi:phosphate-selective porin OprO/OprP